MIFQVRRALLVRMLKKQVIVPKSEEGSYRDSPFLLGRDDP
jgi:hypothetical protein